MWLTIGIIFFVLFIALMVFGFFDTRKTNRWTGFGRNKGFEFYYDKYEKEFLHTKNTNQAIKRGLYELLLIQNNLKYHDIPVGKKYYYPKDIAEYLDKDIDFDFEVLALSFVEQHTRVKNHYIPLLKKRYIQNRNVCDEELNKSYEKTTFQYFKKAAGEDNYVITVEPSRLAFVLVGHCYLQGLGIDKDEKKAKEYFDKAKYNFENTAGGYKLDTNNNSNDN